MNNNRKSADIESLYSWISNTNEQLSHMPMGQVYTLSQNISQQIRKCIINASNDIQHEYPYYARILLRLETILFPLYQPVTGMVVMNSTAFGELFVIITQIHQEPINEQFWENIHPRIIEVSKALYCDGHFSSAYEAAIKEVEKRMRDIFRDAKPNSPVPKDASQLINALLSENGIYSFCERTDISGENFHKGTKLIFEGVFTAYRNPSMHTNMNYTQKEAFEQIVQASQMMTILTRGEIKK